MIVNFLMILLLALMVILAAMFVVFFYQILVDEFELARKRKEREEIE